MYVLTKNEKYNGRPKYNTMENVVKYLAGVNTYLTAFLSDRCQLQRTILFCQYKG